jgi:hypothetical protein
LAYAANWRDAQKTGTWSVDTLARDFSTIIKHAGYDSTVYGAPNGGADVRVLDIAFSRTADVSFNSKGNAEAQFKVKGTLLPSYRTDYRWAWDSRTNRSSGGQLQWKEQGLNWLPLDYSNPYLK